MSNMKATFLVKRDTTANWYAHPDFIPAKGQIIVFTDREQQVDEHGNTINIPGIKIGDGLAYCVDLPFVSGSGGTEILEELRTHEADTVVHITQAERNFWNSKVNVHIQGESLILSDH